jgi:hypothetical protein
MGYPSFIHFLAVELLLYAGNTVYRTEMVPTL